MHDVRQTLCTMHGQKKVPMHDARTVKNAIHACTDLGKAPLCLSDTQVMADIRVVIGSMFLSIVNMESRTKYPERLTQFKTLFFCYLTTNNWNAYINDLFTVWNACINASFVDRNICNLCRQCVPGMYRGVKKLTQENYSQTMKKNVNRKKTCSTKSSIISN